MTIQCKKFNLRNSNIENHERFNFHYRLKLIISFRCKYIFVWDSVIEGKMQIILFNHFPSLCYKLATQSISFFIISESILLQDYIVAHWCINISTVAIFSMHKTQHEITFLICYLFSWIYHFRDVTDFQFSFLKIQNYWQNIGLIN